MCIRDSPYNGALSWKIDEWRNQKKFKLTHTNFFETGVEGILEDIETELDLSLIHILYSYVTDYGVGTMQDLINLTFSMKGLSLITDFSDAEPVSYTHLIDFKLFLFDGLSL